MSNYYLCQIYQNHSLNMVMSRDNGFKFRKILFSPNSVLNFWKSCQIWGKLAQEQKVIGKKQIGGGGKHPPVLTGLKISYKQELFTCKFCSFNFSMNVMPKFFFITFRRILFWSIY